MWFMLNYTAQYNANMVKRRFTGEYESDDWGLDWEFLDAIRPFLNFLYKVYWRVEVAGIENVPTSGPALMVANHAGLLPWDSLMVTASVLAEHPAQRLVRCLHGSWLSSIPFLSHIAVKLGQAVASVDNGTRLLEQDEVVAVFPEGIEGLGKPITDRYKLARFQQVDFVPMALSNGVAVIPVAIVGAEETQIALRRSALLGRLTEMPHAAVTTTFPWLGILGLVPLPSKWCIEFGEPIELGDYGPDAAANLVLVSQLTDEVRHRVQEMLHSQLKIRRTAWF
jgi:1-acyl-sn-glycerol-3-phosphate acyltransferase